MYVITKTSTGNSGKTYKKILTGKSRISAEFTQTGYAVNVITWKTAEGAQKFMNERPTFQSAHQAGGDVVAIERYDARRGVVIGGDMVKFHFAGHAGAVHHGVIVNWAGMSMHIDNCHGEMRAAINAALNDEAERETCAAEARTPGYQGCNP